MKQLPAPAGSVSSKATDKLTAADVNIKFQPLIKYKTLGWRQTSRVFQNTKSFYKNVSSVFFPLNKKEATFYRWRTTSSPDVWSLCPVQRRVEDMSARLAPSEADSKVGSVTKLTFKMRRFLVCFPVFWLKKNTFLQHRPLCFCTAENRRLKRLKHVFIAAFCQKLVSVSVAFTVCCSVLL